MSHRYAALPAANEPTTCPAERERRDREMQEEKEKKNETEGRQTTSGREKIKIEKGKPGVTGGPVRHLPLLNPSFPFFSIYSH